MLSLQHHLGDVMSLPSRKQNRKKIVIFFLALTVTRLLNMEVRLRLRSCSLPNRIKSCIERARA